MPVAALAGREQVLAGLDDGPVERPTGGQGPVECGGELGRGDVPDRQRPPQHRGGTGADQAFAHRREHPAVGGVAGQTAGDEDQPRPVPGHRLGDLVGGRAGGRAELVLHQEDRLPVVDGGVAAHVQDVEVARAVVAAEEPQPFQGAALLDDQIGAGAAGRGQDRGLLGLVVEHRLDTLGRGRHEQHPQRPVARRDRGLQRRVVPTARTGSRVRRPATVRYAPSRASSSQGRCRSRCSAVIRSIAPAGWASTGVSHRSSPSRNFASRAPNSRSRVEP